MTQSDDFAKAIGFACNCMMANFQNSLISRIFGVFSSGFLHRTTLNDFWNRFSHIFLEFKFLTHSEDFLKAIVFA